MKTEEPCFYLDLRDERTRNDIARVAPGGTVVVKVLSTTDAQALAISATGRRTQAGDDFIVEVATPTGISSHSRGWDELQIDLKAIDD